MDEPDLLADCTVDRKVPTTLFVVLVYEAFLQCPKALIRANLWSDETKIPREAMLTTRQIYKHQIALGTSAKELETSFVGRLTRGRY